MRKCWINGLPAWHKLPRKKKKSENCPRKYTYEYLEFFFFLEFIMVQVSFEINVATLLG